jgi:hypothetical protein
MGKEESTETRSYFVAYFVPLSGTTKAEKTKEDKAVSDLKVESWRRRCNHGGHRVHGEEERQTGGV